MGTRARIVGRRSPPRWLEVGARLSGAVFGGVAYLLVREFASFKGMYRSYDLLTVGVVGSLVGAAFVNGVAGERNPMRRRWARLTPALFVPLGFLLWADRHFGLGLSVRLTVVSSIAAYELGAPGTHWLGRAVFLFVPVGAAFLHAYLFTQNTLTTATFESTALGAVMSILVLAGLYRGSQAG